jgi:hypothetical protein
LIIPCCGCSSRSIPVSVLNGVANNGITIVINGKIVLDCVHFLVLSCCADSVGDVISVSARLCPLLVFDLLIV